MSLISYFEKTKVTDNAGVTINPTEEESVILLRRIVKLLESSAVVDSTNRQKMVVEQITGTQLGTAINNINVPTAGAPLLNTGFFWQPVWIGPVDQRWQIVDAARNTYANGIRSKLVWT